MKPTYLTNESVTYVLINKAARSTSYINIIIFPKLRMCSYTLGQPDKFEALRTSCSSVHKQQDT